MFKNLDASIRYLKGVGPKKAQVFSRLGIETIIDLLYYFPYRYEDRRQLKPISEAEAGQMLTLKAKVIYKNLRKSFRRRGFSVLEVLVSNDTGKITAVWFNQPYLDSYFNIGQEVVLFGKVEQYAERLQINSPEFEILGSSEDDKADTLSVGRIVPIYSLTQGITQRYLRWLINLALEEYLSKVVDPLSYDIRKRRELLNLAQGLRNIHFPEDEALRDQAYKRLSFDDFFLYQVPVVLRKRSSKEKKGISHAVDEAVVDGFIQGLGFELTSAQQRVLKEIKADMVSTRPMQRLLQGDVGSGKTVVASCAALMALSGGWQVAFMVPTEILATQHYETVKKQIAKIKFDGKKIKVALLTSSLTAAKKKTLYKNINAGATQLVIGTHALIQEELSFKNLGLVVIDEQHKFGVAQRALLPQKGDNPDVLIMTATPIPRTLSMTVYGDLDISSIDEMPKGRLAVKTELYNEEQREKVYDFISKKVAERRQVYVIYPIIEVSVNVDLKAAEQMHTELKKVFAKYAVGLIHGRLKQKQQDEIMRAFKSGAIHILVATSVLEVGMDVPNASVMVVEHAERFGLSQLHQLRGRIGRGKHQSFCILIADPKNEAAVARIKAITKLSDGFDIAEEDLRIRGPGEFFGKRQSGLSELRIANPITQMHSLKAAREEAIALIQQDPSLSQRQNAEIKKLVQQRFPEYEQLMLV
ncbi:ATP-dependent DNA helicase RecG [Candidatus Omnitrophota bacterium]